MSIVTAIIARNEADRYLGRVVRHCATFSDKVLVLDDRSTDATVEVAMANGAEVRVRAAGSPCLWGTETLARKELWDWGAGECGTGFLLLCDADQILMGDPRPYCDTWMCNTWSFPLYDCWNDESTFRADGYWQGYKHPRPWLFRPGAVPEGWVAQWSGRGLHAGHAPSNWPMMEGFANGLYWLHLGWLKPEDRKAKYERYKAQWDQLTEFEQNHVASILEG